MPARTEIQQVVDHLESYLTGALLPFWMDNAPDADYGGVLSYFDRHGKPTGETDKTFLMQARMLYTMSSAHRAGYGGGRCAELARKGRASSPSITGIERTTAGSGSPTARETRRSWTRSATASASASTLSASTSWPPATRWGKRWRCARMTRSAGTWPTRATAGTWSCCTRDWQPGPPGASAATARSWTCTCT